MGCHASDNEHRGGWREVGIGRPHAPHLRRHPQQFNGLQLHSLAHSLRRVPPSGATTCHSSWSSYGDGRCEQVVMSPPSSFSLGSGVVPPPLPIVFHCCCCALPLSQFSSRPFLSVPEFCFEYCPPPPPLPGYVEAERKVQMRPDLVQYLWKDG
jgi:hypothetical protein